MKQRFSYLDLRLIVNELEQALLDSRLKNIYSLESSQRHFLFKFGSKNDNSDHFLIVDPGMRLHTTKFQHQATLQPSSFVAKLRKHLKNLRVTKMYVPQGNRALIITLGDNHYKLIFEFFAGGNIVLVDNTDKIVALMRIVRNMLGEVQYGVGKTLELQDKQVGFPSEENLEKCASGKEKIGRALHSKVPNASLSMVEYCLRENGIDPKSKSGDIEGITAAAKQCVEWADRLMAQTKTQGFILSKGEGEDKESLEFEPFREYFDLEIESHPGLSLSSCDTYNGTVDEFYGSILAGKQTSKLDQLQKVAENRLNAARNEKENRVRGLDQVQQQNELFGTLLQENADIVDAAISAVKALVDQGLDWGDIESIISLEKKKRNPIAKYISKLELDRDVITLALPKDKESEGPEEDSDASDSDDEISARERDENVVNVRVKLGQGAWANARDYFNIRRAAGAKKEKTVQQADKALKSAEKKIQRDLEKSLAKSSNKNTGMLHTRRSVYWFEKFYWFISSDRMLVIGGRDALQNSLLLTRYFEKDDCLVHSDVEGASVLIIKNDNGKEISPKTFSEASAFCLATSKAWELKKAGTAWYVARGQVPRLGPGGNPISVGEMASTAHRTVILPANFDMGFGLLWQVENEKEELEVDTEVGDSDEEFPDTQLDSDEDFPDTQLASDNESDSDSAADSDVSESAYPPVSEEKSASADVPASASEHANSDEVSSPNDVQTVEQATSAVEESPDPELESHVNSEGSANTSLQSQADATSKKVRGKNKKLKKLKKYADQDEEDRQAALDRLGTLKGLERQEQETREKEEKRLQERELKRQRQERARKAELARIANEVVEDTPFPADLTYRYPEDKSKVVSAVPVFGPWYSLKDCTFKVKVIPGANKKGKTVSEVLRVILDSSTTDKPSQRQKDLVAGVQPQSMQQELPMSRMQLSTGNKSKGGAANRGQKKPQKKKK